MRNETNLASAILNSSASISLEQLVGDSLEDKMGLQSPAYVIFITSSRVGETLWNVRGGLVPQLYSDGKGATGHVVDGSG